MKTPTLQDAIDLATAAHAGQKDKAGDDYISHPLRLMNAVEGEVAKIVAVLHDAIEDTFVTSQTLREAGYGEQIIAAIEGVTKRPDEAGSDAGYENFVRRAAQNPLSKAVKIADLKDNLDMTRLPEITKKDEERKEKYERALKVLEGE